MTGIEKIFCKQKLLAIVFRKNITVKGAKFLTEDDNLFQVGIHQRKKGIILAPHIHKISEKIEINNLQEVLFVTRGKIRVIIYTKKGSQVARKILTAGDSILLIDGGHGVDFLEDSRIFEVKQGPFLGTVHAKIFLK